MKVQKIQAKNILVKSPIHGDYAANPYGGCTHSCVYCYARYLKDWTGHDSDRWGEYVDVKYWEPLTDKQKKKLQGKRVFISSATDPYQPLELEYSRTRALLEQLVGVGMDVTVVTKSDIVVRDIDLLKELNATVALSINTLDEKFRTKMDRSTTIAQKFKAMEGLYNNGIHTVCFISPTFPGITDVPEIIEAATGKCDAIWIEHLVLNGDYKGPVMFHVKTNYPQYFEFYDRIFNKGDLTPWWEFDDYMEDWCGNHGYKYAYEKFPKEHRERPTVTNFRGHKGK